jgi:hypothetical protein
LRKDRRLIVIVSLRPGWNLTHGADHSTLDRCEDVTPRLCIELGLIDRHENVANRFRARAHAINWTQGVHLALEFISPGSVTRVATWHS